MCYAYTHVDKQKLVSIGVVLYSERARHPTEWIRRDLGHTGRK